MHTVIHTDDIIIKDRQRQKFDDRGIQELADSIARVGLIHAPVVELTSNRLLAGERRIRAMKALNKPFLYGSEQYEYPTIPVHIIERDNPQLMFEIELEENLRRENLTPMEEAQALARLHNIRTETNPKQTVKDTAKEVSKLRGKEHNENDEKRLADAILVDTFKEDPEVQKAAKQSLRKGAKVARKKMELEFSGMLSRMEQSHTNPLYTVLSGDCREIVPTFETGSFDVLLFDPPYGVSADKFGEQAFSIGHVYDDTWENARDLTNNILYHSQNYLKPNAHVLQFCSLELWWYWTKHYERALGYAVWPRPIIWYKGQQAHVPVPDFGPRYSYECILFAMRGRRQINTLINDVLTFPPPRDKIHAAEKPAELLATLIDFVAGPGTRILDPTVGSGSIFLGGKDKEVFITGIEADPNYYAIAKQRAEK